jgi:hypothetical protein
MHLLVKQPASTRALLLPEIVTLIMHQMDMRTLLITQRVCRAWKNVIQSSHSLQKALFLLPDHTSKDPTKPRLYNPLLAESFPSFFPPTLDNDSIEQLTLTTLPFIKTRETLKTYLRPEASWRRMLTTQPPVHTIGRFICGSGMLGLNWHQQKAKPLKDGLRMGTLFEMIIKLDRYEWNNSEIRISLGGEVPVNAPAETRKPSIYLAVERLNADWGRMLRETDLVLVSGGHVDCTDPEGPEDPSWVKSEDEVVWEEICDCYGELGISLADLPMEKYNKGWSGWQ